MLEKANKWIGVGEKNNKYFLVLSSLNVHVKVKYKKLYHKQKVYYTYFLMDYAESSLR